MLQESQHETVTLSKTRVFDILLYKDRFQARPTVPAVSVESAVHDRSGSRRFNFLAIETKRLHHRAVTHREKDGFSS